MFGGYYFGEPTPEPPGRFQCTNCSTLVVFASEPEHYSLETKDQLSKKKCSRCYDARG